MRWPTFNTIPLSGPLGPSTRISAVDLVLPWPHALGTNPFVILNAALEVIIALLHTTAGMLLCIHLSLPHLDVLSNMVPLLGNCHLLRIHVVPHKVACILDIMLCL